MEFIKEFSKELEKVDIKEMKSNETWRILPNVNIKF